MYVGRSVAVGYGVAVGTAAMPLATPASTVASMSGMGEETGAATGIAVGASGEEQATERPSVAMSRVAPMSGMICGRLADTG